MRKSILFLFSLILFSPAASTVDARLTPQRTVLGNGMVLLTSEEKALPMVALNLLIRAGSRYDPPGKAGLANLTARLLTYGTASRSALQISEELDFAGARLSAGCGEELATVSLTVLKKDLDVGLKILADVLTASLFPPEEIDRQKQSVLASIRARNEEPGALAEMRFMEALFPSSPYGLPVEGSAKSVQTLERADLLQFYREYYHPNRAILAVVGDVTDQEVKEKLADVFRSWESGGPAAGPVPSAAPGPANIIRVQKDLTQANIILGHEGVPRAHPDYYPIQVMNYILGGGGFSSRLVDAIRNQRGLAYSVYSGFDAGRHVGTFEIAMQTKNESTNEAIRLAIDEVRRIRAQGVSDTELQAAKDYLMGSFPLRFDSDRRRAEFFAQVEFFQLGLDYPERYPEMIRAVSREDVLRVARRYLEPEKLIVVIVANQEKVASKNRAGGVKTGAEE